MFSLYQLYLFLETFNECFILYWLYLSLTTIVTFACQGVDGGSDGTPQEDEQVLRGAGGRHRHQEHGDRARAHQTLPPHVQEDEGQPGL